MLIMQMLAAFLLLLNSIAKSGFSKCCHSAHKAEMHRCIRCDALQAYVQKQAQCLLQLEGNSDSSNPALAEMHRWSVESTAMLICFATGSTSNQVFSWLNMKDGTLFQNGDGDPAELLVRHADGWQAALVFCAFCCHGMFRG